MKILYLCTRPEAQNNGGSVVAGRNLCAIRQIVGEESVEVVISLNRHGRLLGALWLH